MSTTIRSVDEVARKASRTLLSEIETPEAISQAAEDFFAVLTEFTAISETPSARTQLPSGHALSPLSAALCVADSMRTAMFVRGVHDAWRALALEYPGQTPHVLYAGCGPFAPLILLPLLAPDTPPVSITVLDIHQQSLDSVKRLFQELGLERHIAQSVCADAASYKPAEPQHMVIAEVMQAGLRREPQLAVTQNLARYILPRGILIPEQIVVEAGLLLPGGETKSLGRLIELTRHQTELPATVEITAPKLETPAQLALLTFIKVFQQHELRDNEAGLTCPVVLEALEPGKSAVKYRFRYEYQPDPRFLWTKLPPRV